MVKKKKKEIKIVMFVFCCERMKAIQTIKINFEIIFGVDSLNNAGNSFTEI